LSGNATASAAIVSKFAIAKRVEKIVHGYGDVSLNDHDVAACSR